MRVRWFKSDLLLSLLLVIPALEAATVEFDSAGFTQQVEASAAQKMGLDWDSIRRLYEHLGEPFIWHQGETLNAQGRQLSAWLFSAEAEGLNPADYHVNQLQQQSLPDDPLLRELLLTDGYLRLAVDLRLGNQTARFLDPFGKLQLESFDPVEALIEALAQKRLPEMLAGLSPARVEYSRLRQALVRYQELEKQGGWPRLESDHSLRPGRQDPLIVHLRERLARETGWSNPIAEDQTLFDADLQAEVQRFQTRHGLEADGVVGEETLQALNVPVGRRVEQLRANLERWRWLPRELGTEHLLVNTAGFDITLQSHDRVVFSGRTVNGREERPTPSMVSSITHLVANPQWTVPRRIAVEDMLPRQQADPSYLSSKGIRSYRREAADWQEFDPATIDWALYHRDNFPFILKQDAGAGNSLGRVKFHMPNRQAIYLHDTPAVGLFTRSHRALSSGCVRVEDADQLASLLITRADPWEADKFTQAMRTGETLIVPLREPIPVYLTYFTSWVGREGEVQFRPDIYQRDRVLMLAIARDDHPVTAQWSVGSLPASL
ncbi:MAG: L,D-transpeptidase family protein [Candidatus Thiodiazotropha sp.]